MHNETRPDEGDAGMSVYRGVVRGNVIVLRDDVRLADGTTVEVRIIRTAAGPSQRSHSEDAFEQQLLESGLITEINAAPGLAPAGDRAPVEVQGRPLSEVIIDERR
jgi:hypothetical protein